MDKKLVIVIVVLLFSSVCVYSQSTDHDPLWDDPPSDEPDYESSDWWAANAPGASSALVGQYWQYIPSGVRTSLSADQLGPNIHLLSSGEINSLQYSQISGLTPQQSATIFQEMSPTIRSYLTGPQLTQIMTTYQLGSLSQYNPNELITAFRTHYNNPSLYIDVTQSDAVLDTSGTNDILTIGDSTVLLDTFNLHEHSITSTSNQWLIVDDIMFKNVVNLERSDKNCNNDNCLNADSAEEARIPNARGRAEARNIRDFTIDSDHEYFFTSADFVDDNGIKVLSGTDILSANSLYRVGVSPSINIDNLLSTTFTQGFTYNYLNKIDLDHTDSLIIFNNQLNNISNASFTFEDNLDQVYFTTEGSQTQKLHNEIVGSGSDIIIDSQDQSKVSLLLTPQETTIVADQNSIMTLKSDNLRKIIFTPQNIQSAMTIRAAPVPRYDILNGILQYENNDIEEELSSGMGVNSVEIDLSFGFRCLALSRDALYYYYGDDYSSFSIRNPDYSNETYSFCMIKKPEDLFTGNVVDLIEKKMVLKGKVELNKFVFLVNRNIVNPIMTPIYKSYLDTNSVGFRFDSDMTFIDPSYLQSTRTTDSASLHSGYFTINERDRRSVRIEDTPAPAAIQSYLSDLDDTQILIDLDLLQINNNNVRIIREPDRVTQFERWLADE